VSAALYHVVTFLGVTVHAYVQALVTPWFSTLSLHDALPISGILHVHLKDVASSAAGWEFTAIGDGSIDYRAVWAELSRDVPVCIELPLRLDRTDRTAPSRRVSRVPLVTIRTAMRRSLDRVAELDGQ